MCRSCNRVCCFSCFKKFTKSDMSINYTFPCLCKDNTVEIIRNVDAMSKHFKRIKIKCPFNHKKCKKELNYYDIYEKKGVVHYNNAQYQESQCHLKECEHQPIQCLICDETIKFEQAFNHRAKCGTAESNGTPCPGEDGATPTPTPGNPEMSKRRRRDPFCDKNTPDDYDLLDRIDKDEDSDEETKGGEPAMISNVPYVSSRKGLGNKRLHKEALPTETIINTNGGYSNGTSNGMSNGNLGFRPSGESSGKNKCPKCQAVLSSPIPSDETNCSNCIKIEELTNINHNYQL